MHCTPPSHGLGRAWAVGTKIDSVLTVGVVVVVCTLLIRPSGACETVCVCVCVCVCRGR
jgi:hypothetical protein